MISDEDRKHLEEALAAALLLIWQDRADEAMADLGLAEQAFHATPEMIAKLNAEAADVAATVQDGINQRLADAQSGAEDAPTLEQVQQEVQEYNETVLQAYLTSFARGAALLDVYSATPNPDDPSQTMKDAVQWRWVQTLIYDDECREADAASPASYDDLMAITGAPPPLHRRCGCYLEVATPVAG